MTVRRDKFTPASDFERRQAASKFFWDMMDQWGGPILTPQEAHRHIDKLAECLPPFTKIKQ